MYNDDAAEKTYKPKKWMKLDNAAKIYPAASSRRWMALFRVSACLDEDVDRDILEQALKNVLVRMPSFAQRLRRGLFWYYLEHLGGSPGVSDDAANPCVRMDLKRNGGFMLRARCYHNRIAVEFFHVLSDGTGGLSFLKTLVAEYLRLRHGTQIEAGGGILDCREQPRPEEMEDGFLRYARGVKRTRKEAVAYRIKGTRGERDYMNIITGITDAQGVIDMAKGYGASVNEFLTALLIMAVYRISQREHSLSRRMAPVKVCVPVNLRRFYSTPTLRNFASYVNPGIEPVYGQYTLEETIKIVKNYMALETTEKLLNAKFSTNVGTEKNRLLRAAPLFIKKPAMKIAYLINGDRMASTILSNLGNVVLPRAMEEHVERMDFMLGSLRLNPVTCACLSYKGKMYINFTRAIREAGVEREFFTSMVKLGLHVKIESNERY